MTLRHEPCVISRPVIYQDHFPLWVPDIPQRGEKSIEQRCPVPAWNDHGDEKWIHHYVYHTCNFHPDMHSFVICRGERSWERALWNNSRI